MGYTRGEFMQMGLAGLLASGEVAAQEQTRQPSYLCVYRPGPRWLPGKPLAEQPLREHGRYMLDLYKRGVMRMAGRFADGSGGAIAECRASVVSDCEELEQAGGDPGRAAGIADDRDRDGLRHKGGKYATGGEMQKSQARA